MKNIYVQYAFAGIKCCVAFLILKAGIEMISKEKKSIFSIIILLIVFTIMILFDLFSIQFSSIYLIIIGGLIGIIFSSIIDILKRRKEQ